MENLIVRMKNERLRQGMTRKALGEKAGIKYRNIEAWEQGHHGMSIEQADKVFKALGVSITIGAEEPALQEERG